MPRVNRTARVNRAGILTLSATSLATACIIVCKAATLKVIRELFVSDAENDSTPAEPGYIDILRLIVGSAIVPLEVKAVRAACR